MQEDTGLTPSQRRAKSLFDMGESLFLTGKAGTGKSYLASRIIDGCSSSRRNVVICAPTGIAALNVGGATIHRAFGLPLSVIEPYRSCRDKGRLKMLAAADVVVVDEISMCRQDLFTAMVNSLEKASRMRGAKRHKQLLVVGDFHQLPPVLTQREESLYGNFYEGLYPFQGDAWSRVRIRTVELQENMRQKDARLMRMLDNIREGVPDFGCLEARTVAIPDPDAISLCTTNRRADEVNVIGLGRLHDREAVFTAVSEGAVCEGDKPVPDTFSVKVGARVMTVVNSDEDGGGYHNGSLGTVASIDGTKRTVWVRFDHSGETLPVKPYLWEIYDYGIENRKIDGGGPGFVESVTKRKVGSYCQLPLKLAWAVTVHKSQGQTYDRVNIYASERYFAPGQLYVALSRCRTLEGMNIIGRFSPSAVITDPAVRDFGARLDDFRDSLF